MKTYLVIFGATGNLTMKKLLPALAMLHRQNVLPTDFHLHLISRSPYNTASYLDFAKASVQHPKDIDELAPFSTYQRFDYEQEASYVNLAKELNAEPSEVVFYLALGPDLFPLIARNLSTYGLVSKGSPHARIAFEKPFGDSLASAQQINTLVWTYFDESQLYRVDHYLGKEMIQNLLMIRFANPIFETNWNHTAIEKVTIIAKETEGVMNRGTYYDQAGAFIDMVQSHLLQMAALTAMEPPLSYDENGIRTQKVKVLNALRVETSLVTGQYEGYHQEKNIDPQSTTETFVAFKAFFDTPRWQNVPFYFVTGKKLDAKVSEIRIDYKWTLPANNPWSTQGVGSNQLIIRVAPEEGITFRLNVKAPGLTDHIQSMLMDYCHDCQYVGNHPEAYQRIIADLIKGQSTLFTRWDEIETAWTIVDAMRRQAPDVIIYRSWDDLKPHLEKVFHIKLDETTSHIAIQ